MPGASPVGTAPCSCSVWAVSMAAYPSWALTVHTDAPSGETCTLCGPLMPDTVVATVLVAASIAVSEPPASLATHTVPLAMPRWALVDAG